MGMDVQAKTGKTAFINFEVFPFIIIRVMSSAIADSPVPLVFNYRFLTG